MKRTDSIFQSPPQMDGRHSIPRRHDPDVVGHVYQASQPALTPAMRNCLSADRPEVAGPAACASSVRFSDL